MVIEHIGVCSSGVSPASLKRYALMFDRVQMVDLWDYSFPFLGRFEPETRGDFEFLIDRKFLSVTRHELRNKLKDIMQSAELEDELKHLENSRIEYCMLIRFRPKPTIFRRVRQC
jgi:hypothetical protein